MMDTVRTLLSRRSLGYRLLRPLVAFLALVAVGVGGFRALTGIGVVNGVFWLLDPTSIELYFEHHSGPARFVKAYAIVVLTGVVVVGMWTGETVLAAAFGGRIRNELSTMKTKQEIEELENHVVICGYGAFGETIATQLRDAGTPVVVVEERDAQYERAVEGDGLAIQGDARREETLLDAGVKRAATVIGAIDDTNANVKIAVTTSQLNPNVRLVVRAGDRTDEAVARRVGADEVIVPEVVSAKQVCADL